jgi:hypothetical protein
MDVSAVPSSRINLTLEDRQLLPFFQGVPAYDIVKIILEDDTAETSMYFGKCVAFLRDSNMKHYVLLHWFTRQEPATGFNVVSDVPSFKLARMDQTLSYSVVPVECILNGGVLLPGPPPQIGTLPQPDACYWALLSPGNATGDNAPHQDDDDADNVKPLVNEKFFLLDIRLELSF